MKTLLKLCLTLVFILQGIQANAQHLPEPKKLTDFSFMTGDWEGTGTSYTRQGPVEFNVTETIAYAADSTTLLIKGHGFDDQGINHHDAVGVLYFDNGAYHMHAFTKQGQNVIAYVTKTGDHSFDWGFDLPNGGKIKYSASFTEDTWKESGTYTTPDGTQSFPTVQMNLSRK